MEPSGREGQERQARTSITAILGQSLILVALVPFLPIAWLTWHDYGDEAARIEAEIQETNRQIAELAAGSLDGLVRQVRDRAMVAFGGHVKWPTDPLPSALPGVRWELVAGDGQVVASGVSPDRVGRGCGYVGDPRAILSAAPSSGFSRVERWIDGFPPTSVLPLRLDPDRWLVAVLDPEALRRLLISASAALDRHVYAVDATGRLLFYSDPVVTSRGDDVRHNPPIRLFTSGGSGEIRFRSVVSGKERLGFVHRAAESGWGVVVSADIDTRLVALRDRYRALALSIAFALLAALAILLWTSRRLARPLLDIRDALRAGDRPGRSPLGVPGSARDIAEYDELVGAFDDLSARFAATERELVQAEKTLLLGQLASGLAHEIGTPLNVISGNAQYLLKKAGPDHPAAATLQLIVKQAERITAMIRRLLDFSRPTEARLVAVDLGAVVRQVVEMVPGMTRKVEVRTDIDPATPPVLGDPRLLEHALVNLIVNARQAMPDGGTLSIVVGVGTPDEQRRRRRGAPGVPAGRRHRLRHRGGEPRHGCSSRSSRPRPRARAPAWAWRSSSVSSASTAAASRCRARSAGAASSRCGCARRLRGPRIRQGGSMGDGREGRPVTGGPVRVLVAEDDGEMLDLIRRVLSDEGYAVLTAGDGQEALARLDDGEFDIVLTDVRMPGADGVAVLRRAMTRHLHQPVILMTAFGSISSAVEAMREGAFHYLAKPFDLDDLLGIVSSAATQIRQLRESNLGELESDPFFPVVFRSRAMRELLLLAREVASSTATVLVQGSSGTGKELLARAIHRMSRRRDRPFVAVDCSAIPETLLESELFGHARGRLHRRGRGAIAASSRRPTAARCSSTRWATSPRPSRPSCSASSRSGATGGSATPWSAPSTSGSCRRATATSAKRSGGAPSARTSSTGCR